MSRDGVTSSFSQTHGPQYSHFFRIRTMSRQHRYSSPSLYPVVTRIGFRRFRRCWHQIYIQEFLKPTRILHTFNNNYDIYKGKFCIWAYRVNLTSRLRRSSAYNFRSLLVHVSVGKYSRTAAWNEPSKLLIPILSLNELAGLTRFLSQHLWRVTSWTSWTVTPSMLSNANLSDGSKCHHSCNRGSLIHSAWWLSSSWAQWRWNTTIYSFKSIELDAYRAQWRWGQIV